MVLTVEGTNVWIQRARSQQRESAYPSQVLEVKDRGFTGPRSRASVRLSDLSVARIGEQSEFEIEPLPDPALDGSFNLLRGWFYLLHRDRPGSHRFVTPTATAATRGTEFVLEVDALTGRTALTVLEGEAELRNAEGVVILARGDQGVALRGQPPTKTAVIDAASIVQWCLYYPGVLELSELGLTPEAQVVLGDSLNAWRRGNLLRAVALYPAGRIAASAEENVYYAALLLAVGQVAQAEEILNALPDRASRRSMTGRLGAALHEVARTVRRPGGEPQGIEESAPVIATEWLARSYTLQARSDLRHALVAARRAVERSPDFAFGWVRVAELEFGHARIDAARAALNRGLALGPENAQGIALRGFLLSAGNQIPEAIRSFEAAISIDGGLGNAWLGRGLCRVRRGEAQAGRFDLQVAAMLEPQRSLLRSYLGKSFSNAGDLRRAGRELELAQQLDAGDPTPWLYSALLLGQENRPNEAIHDLERSRALNENRQVYRSRLALDQDRAVRSANLASLYRDVGMADVSLREAARAVNADYANDSAHLFLANSYNQLRDPKRINLRYESAALGEYLLANLLSPVGAGPLSQPLSQQEYGRLLERDRIGISSSTEYRSRGDWSESASQFGNVGDSAYALDVGYLSQRGQRPNNDLAQLETSLSFKQQLSPADTLLLEVTYYNLDAGDVNQYYAASNSNPQLRVHERQEPVVFGGYHHAWGPGSHTLLLAGRVQAEFEVDNPRQDTLFFNRGFGGPIGSVAPLRYRQTYRSDLEIFSGELQQIWQQDPHTFIVGVRGQGGSFATHNRENSGRLFNNSPVSLTVDQDLNSEFDRQSCYVYDQWQLWETLTVSGGLSYDRLRFPENFRYGPISGMETTRDKTSPKAGMIFTPFTNTTLRAAYAQGLGGVSLEQSYRLEPSQVAGFNQAWRSLIPESVAGANAAPTFDTWSLSLEQTFPHGTYLGVGGEILSSAVRRHVGVVQFSVPAVPGPALTTQQTPERLDFRERSVFVHLNQLVGREWSFGAHYRLSNAQLDDRFPAIPASAALLGGVQPHLAAEGLLHQVELAAYYNHPSGFFGGASALWTAQSTQGYHPDRPGEDFWQVNLEAGWRFLRRRVEARVALLNLAGHDYHLNPLNLSTELPRERTLAVRLQFNF